MTTEATRTTATTVEDLTRTTALYLLTSQLGGDPRHGDAAAGFYVDEVATDGASLTVTIGDEQGQTTDVRFTAAQIQSTTTAAGQPTYLDAYPFVAPTRT